MKPARVYCCVGSFGAPVSFSSDEQGMPREFMGVYTFFQKPTPHLVLHMPCKQDLVGTFA